MVVVRVGGRGLDADDLGTAVYFARKFFNVDQVVLYLPQHGDRVSLSFASVRGWACSTGSSLRWH